MATRKKTGADAAIVIPELKKGRVTMGLVGTEPLILNTMSEKTRQGLLLPGEAKRRSARALTLKHNPLEEFHGSAMRMEDPDAPTELALPATAFKGAMRNAALRCEGASKQLIGEMLYVPGQQIAVYGRPMIFTTMVRNSDIGRTPDMRTRCIVSPWAVVLTVVFTMPYLNEQSVANLAAMAGQTQGVGDGRTGKGWGNFGAYRMTGGDDAELLRIMKEWGRTQQVEALDQPDPFDRETGGLLGWFEDECDRRGLKTEA